MLGMITTSIRETFGVVKGNSTGRNSIAVALTYAPNIPTYFMPAYWQASHTGNASELKKGEGIRGILTGSLDGACFGALTAGKDGLKTGRIFTFIIIGALLDYVSSKILPPLGESVGKMVYNSKKSLKPKRNQEATPPQAIPLKPFLTASTRSSDLFSQVMAKSKANG